MSKLRLKNLQTVSYGTWRSSNRNAIRELHVVVSGYESRCIEWARESAPTETPERSALVLGFMEMRGALSRQTNDRFYGEMGLEVKSFATDDAQGVLLCVTAAVQRLQTDETPLHVHIDYSCMPRTWYCSLPFAIESVLRRGDKAHFWYTAGNYSTGEYPTAGVRDFQVFAGRASLNSRFRTHVFGLGFDRIRANAICSVLDPQYLVCFYANPGVKEQYVQKVELDNADILRQANLSFTVPIDDFNTAFTRLCSVANEFQQLGDVILVPDGPKPLILASSLVPLVIGKDGVICFHVRRRKTRDYVPIDVVATGGFYGFSFGCGL